MIVGLDVHKNVCYGIVMNEKGEVAKQDKFTNSSKPTSTENPTKKHRNTPQT